MTNDSQPHDEDRHRDHVHDDSYRHDDGHGDSRDDGHENGHTHDHHGNGDHDHDDDHNHDHDHGRFAWLTALLPWHGHSHDHGELARDRAFLNNELGIRTVWVALFLLLLTTILQVVIVALSGSVALLADTLHNLGDGLNSVPLLIAFYLARRVATRRYTYGYGRAEDVAGIFIVLSIAISAGIIFWESFQKFFEPEPVRNIGWVAAAAIIGFIGNEAVAIIQIRTGRRIGSAALVADGQHARTDGLTSLAVLFAAGGAWLNIPIVDPIIGIGIGIAILFITRDATVAMWYRLMDAVEPELLDKGETAVESVPGISELRRLRLRWIGHLLHAEVFIAVDGNLTTAASHDIAEEVRHALYHALPQLAEAVVHVEPDHVDREWPHRLTLHHEDVPARITE